MTIPPKALNQKKLIELVTSDAKYMEVVKESPLADSRFKLEMSE